MITLGISHVVDRKASQMTMKRVYGRLKGTGVRRYGCWCYSFLGINCVLKRLGLKQITETALHGGPSSISIGHISHSPLNVRISLVLSRRVDL